MMASGHRDEAPGASIRQAGHELGHGDSQLSSLPTVGSRGYGKGEDSQPQRNGFPKL